MIRSAAMGFTPLHLGNVLAPPDVQCLDRLGLHQDVVQRAALAQVNLGQLGAGGHRRHHKVP